MAEPSFSWEPSTTAISIAGLAATILAVATTGGLAMLAGAAAVACLGVSFARSLSESEIACNDDPPACEQIAISDASGPGEEPGRSRQWQQTVAVSRSGKRHR